MLVYLQAIETQEEKSKFETLYLEYRQYMFRVAYAILNNIHDAEDAVQLAFMRAAENIENIGEPVCIKTKGWLVTIVRNAAIDIYRRKRAHPSVEYTAWAEKMCVEYDGSNLVSKCILKLPERQQNLLILKYQYGYDLYEIAEMMGITYRNALQIEQRAKAKLRELCKEEGILC